MFADDSSDMLTLPSSVPQAHRERIEAIVQTFERDPRIVGVAAGGSMLNNNMDEFSDLDLVVAVEPARWDETLAARQPIAAAAGPLLCSFTGEHVGEPRLLICLYAGQPPVHVDYKFVALPDVAVRVEEPLVLWERDGRMSKTLEAGSARFPEPDRQWIEDRFWIWVHYAAVKIGRGELFEALDMLGYLRATVLGPLALHRRNARPSGVRRLEMYAPDESAAFEATIAGYAAKDCVRALRASISLYRRLRDSTNSTVLRMAAEEAACQYLDELAARLHKPAS
jgi:hypothetical protein